MTRIGKITLFILIFSTLINIAFAQNSADTILIKKQKNTERINYKDYTFSYKKLIVPAIFISYGVASMEIKGLKQLNFSTRNEIIEDKPSRLNWDNYTQYAPALMVYGLNAAGIKGKHCFKDRTIIYATSQLISTTIVTTLKNLVKEERPDQTNNLSFPSGHTATAFSSAQFMFREYKDTNFGLSISGYSFALFTGIYRTINNKHWVGDVVAGAGFGILSTESAYWLYPGINRMLSGKRKNSTTIVMPFYQNKGIGIGLVSYF